MALTVLVSVGLGMWRFARYAGRIEDDSDDMVEGGLRRPYGEKWLSILHGNGGE